ncbi:PepSY domain-containing protein [Massilia sp. NEAU-DD11]|uniref:PepSY domain-containing protein n=1 Tax=Massilia cellulosiltytica TaxID=2683234 RepID=A0A7X3G0N5_9BURK|nr:PepSY domain-containing protein [Telluria cellulosilytica]MVW61511.1 PepSY domain-containing protein [Telluria cellulosilytica]
MRLLITLFVLASLVFGSEAFADIDCTDSVELWKSRDTLRQEVEKNGWTVQRIKVDDGCYEVRAVDRNGNKVKAKYSPATLKIRSFEVEFRPDANTSEYFSPVRKQPGFETKPDR